MEGPGNARLDISPAGDVAIKGNKTLLLNFGQEARAQSFLERQLAQVLTPQAVTTSQQRSTLPDTGGGTVLWLRAPKPSQVECSPAGGH